MQFRYKLKKEFFGGIIYDSKCKKNISIDSELFALLESLLLNKESNLIMTGDEIIESIKQLLLLGVLSTNIKLQDDIKTYDDHLSAPFRIFYDITYQCNLRCKHCFTKSGNKMNNELSLEEKFRLIDEIKKLGTHRISIAGGEPFICEDIFPFLHYCKDNNIDVSITTNSTLFTIPMINKLNECDLKNLTVSFDGGSKHSMEFIRGYGSYEAVINGLRLLKNHYLHNYSLKTTLMKSNIDEIEQIIETAIDCGCKLIKFNCVREDGRAEENNKEVVLNNKEYISVVKYIENLKEKYKDRITIKAPLNIFCDEEYDYIEDLGFGCFAGKESLCINPLGDIKPCSHFPQDYICGNVRNNNLYDIWHNSPVLYEFRHFKGNDTCNNCEKYDLCRAGCRFRAFKSGDINGVDPFCYTEVYHNE